MAARSRRLNRRLIFTLLMAVLAIIATPAGEASAQARGFVTFETSEVVIETRDGKRHDFRVELALNQRQRAQGLMYRPKLAPGAGMLFDYGRETPIAMWMKNTIVPLDMLFIGADGVIVNIAERTVPGSLAPIPSNGPVRAVLEVNAGTTARLGIKPGDRVLHRIFHRPPSQRR
ncbi:MAG: DUF192 domain-containing protein [Alphaproteobacteria bacterium]|nr:DUF192 domain-containing protein [Alphaproteobacteria bacterium]